MRQAVLAAGAQALGGLLEMIGAGRRDEPVMCSCRHRMQSCGIRSKILVTIVGSTPYSRWKFRCPACGEIRWPADELLDVVGTTRSPGLRRMIARTGAEWIWNLAGTHFGWAIQIIDLYHAREHVHDLCKLLFDGDLKKITRYRDRWWDYLDDGNVEKIIEQAQALLPRDQQVRKQPEGQIAYLEKNQTRTRYADFRAQGLFVGSGVDRAA